jgi:signal transduction histidine kinase
VKAALYSEYQLHHVTCQEKFALEMIQKLHQKHHTELSQLIHQRDESYIFIAGIAHDLKIPISIIQLVLEDTDNQNISQEPKEKIRRESDKMIEKLSGLLCYLRLGQFEKDYLIERVNLIDEIRNAINAKKDYFILNNIYPRFNSEQAPIYILTDHKWHSILLDQIISNAIKYSAVKGKQGYVEFNINSSDTSIELTVTDFGVGIPSYEMERIFDPFFTGENGRQVGNSSGIGLYLCRTIAQKLGVGLSLKSVRGEKTEVTIRYLSNL